MTAVTVLVWYANRRALELVGHLLDLANTAAAQFADVAQMLPGYQDLNGLQQGSGEGPTPSSPGSSGSAWPSCAG